MNKTIEPAYLNLLQNGILEDRISTALRHLDSCDLCPRRCGVNRNAGEIGGCRIGKLALVCSYFPHLGEENPIRGWSGSGTIFFGGCNLSCQFCQNFDISQSASGVESTPEEIAEIMLSLQEKGCHNINLVSPSHVVAQIMSAILIAAQNGLQLPLVYNTGGYDDLTALRLLDGVIDIYMPDMKYSSPTLAGKYSGAHDYPRINQTAVLEMYRQVGDLQIDSDGLAYRGLLVRHLVLPQDIAGTKQIVAFLAEKVSRKTYINIMPQYHPAYHANRYPELNRPITAQEYASAVQSAWKVGLSRLDDLSCYLDTNNNL